MLNGDGLRTVLWVSGCAHHCRGCQNPQTWDACSGIPFDDAAKKELFADLSRDYLSGVTFSGGDPLCPGNRETVGQLIAEIAPNALGARIHASISGTVESVSDSAITLAA